MVSAQIMEIIFLAVVAFLVIGKLISVLGVSEEDDLPGNKGSFFGEPGGLKNITAIVETVKKSVPKKDVLADSLLKKTLGPVYEKKPDFDYDRFVEGAMGAFKLIINAINKKDNNTLEHLVDKRFLGELLDKQYIYGEFPTKKLSVKCSDSYSFGNSLYIKLLFEGKNLNSNLKHMKEEWVFTKSINDSNPSWYLSNIEKLSD